MQHDLEYDDDSVSSCENKENDSIYHTLPFKVLGVAHDVSTQQILKQCNILTNGHPETIKIVLTPEPTNPIDALAIAVKVQLHDQWHFVGYIPKELTKYIHEAMKDGKLMSVHICHIKYRVEWKRKGYYMKISITRKGSWPNYVVRKSLSVK